jgi:hypothetical protein
MRHENDGRFPDESEVLVRYPLRQRPGPERQPGQSEDEHLAVLRADRETWPWLLGTIEQCGPDEWLVTIEGPAPGRARRRHPGAGEHAGRGPAVPAGLP